jgi:hypothetical protein
MTYDDPEAIRAPRAVRFSTSYRCPLFAAVTEKVPVPRVTVDDEVPRTMQSRPGTATASPSVSHPAWMVLISGFADGDPPLSNRTWEDPAIPTHTATSRRKSPVL